MAGGRAAERTATVDMFEITEGKLNEPEKIASGSACNRGAEAASCKDCAEGCENCAIQRQRGYSKSSG